MRPELGDPEVLQPSSPNIFSNFASFSWVETSGATISGSAFALEDFVPHEGYHEG